MTVSTWIANTSYAPNALVRPLTEAPPVATAIPNSGFESGAAGWTLGAGMTVVAAGPFTGVNALKHTGTGTSTFNFTPLIAVGPGKEITASVYYSQGGSATAGANSGAAQLRWYNAASVLIRTDTGTASSDQSAGYRLVSVTGTAPDGAAFVSMGGVSVKTQNFDCFFDDVHWNYVSQALPIALVFKATQAAAAVSGATEPVWPAVVGGTVVDGGVTWTAQATSRVTWTAKPLSLSGAVEPVWPTKVGDRIADGNFVWETVSRRVTDPNCPQTAVVVMAKSKIYAGDMDLIRFSATVNPLDWTTANDAGYLPFGLNQNGANDVTTMNLYRGNLVAWNSTTFQAYQIDEDPASNALLDAQEGMGSIWPEASSPVANDLFFLSSLGVRSVGVAIGSVNLQSADVGLPVDDIIQDAIATRHLQPIGCYMPSAGQYWLMFANPPADTTKVFVYTIGADGGGSWSSYTLPLAVRDRPVMLGDKMFLRSTADVISFDSKIFVDFQGHPTKEAGFSSVIHWNYIDCGEPGVTKQLTGVDIVGKGACTIEIGYDETNDAAYTAPYTLPPDTLPGQVIPMAVSAPSFSVRLTYTAGQDWSFNALNLYLADRRPMS